MQRLGSSWRRALIGAALAVAILQVIDAFFVEIPFVSLLFAMLFLVGALWLRRPGSTPVIAVGALCLLRLVLAVAFGVFGPTSGLSGAEVVVAILFGVVAAFGVVVAAGELRSRAPVSAS